MLFPAMDTSTIIALVLVWIVAFLLGFVFCWKRRWMLYYGFKLPGPFAFPFFGSLHLLRGGPQEMFNVLKKLVEDFPEVYKVWFGSDLYVSTTNLNDLKTLTTNHLDKGDFYSMADDYFRGALAGAKVDVWKQHRKMISPSFNPKLLETFFGTFIKQANLLCENLDQTAGKSVDVFLPLWRCTFDGICETLADIDADSLIDRDAHLAGAIRVEEILLLRFFHPIWYVNIFWTFSWLKRELRTIWSKTNILIEQMIRLNRRRNGLLEDPLRKKRFLNIMLDPTNRDLTHKYVLEETSFMLFVGSESSAAALGMLLAILALHPEIQDKIDEELQLIFEDSTRDATVDDINRMEYLDRVIKESLRLLPPIPIVMRSLDTNVKLESGVFPAGAKVIVPITFIHRRADLWPDPLKFDPDRFLPEEVEKRHPLAYLPFSYGIRNCLGYKYAMVSMKVTLSTVLRRFRVTGTSYKSIEEVEFLIHIIAKAKKGYQVTLERKY